MIILSKKAQGEQLNFKSVNDKIIVNITEANNGPLFTLEDKSKIQFTNLIQYYKVITDSEIYNINNQTFDIDKFRYKYLKDTDDVNRYDMSGVEEYTVNDKQAFRYIPKGENRE